MGHHNCDPQPPAHRCSRPPRLSSQLAVGDAQPDPSRLLQPGPYLERPLCLPPVNRLCSLPSAHRIPSSPARYVHLGAHDSRLHHLQGSFIVAAQDWHLVTVPCCNQSAFPAPAISNSTHGSKEGATATKGSSKVLAKHRHKCNSARINRSHVIRCRYMPSTCISVTVRQ